MAGIVVFAWVELVYVDRDDPSTLAIMMLAYAAVQLIGMSIFGITEWLRNADPFGVLFGLFARIAPLHWRDGELAVRRLAHDDERVALAHAEGRLDDRVGIPPELGRVEDGLGVHPGNVQDPGGSAR
jgi:hypothetical protein